MESLNFKTLLISSSIILILSCVLRVLYNIWWRPRSLEKHLRQQGIRGTSYRLLHGDMKEIGRSSMEALSKPMSLNHQIAPRVLPFFHQMVQEYGKVSLSWYETRPRIIVAEAEVIRLILADKHGHFIKPPLNPLVNLLQMGISSLEGEIWARRRKLITPAFHFEKLKGMVPAFLASCCNMIDEWKKLVGSKESYEMDVVQQFQNLAGDVIARTAFGSSYEEGKKIFELQKEQAVLVLEAFRSIYIPGLRFIPTKKNKKRYNLDNEIKSILRNMIERKEEAMKNGESGSCDDLLGLLLQCKKEADNFMTNEDVIEECKLFYIAGQETTAHLLTWTVIVLSLHPNWQDKAREEVMQICGKKTFHLDALNHLKIVSMILHEVLRLYPPVPALYRHTHKSTNIGGISIPAGVDIYLPILLLHFNPEYWGEDAEEFKPQRFSEGVSKASKDQNAFYPFGWGPRICLGQSFAMIETKMALALILQNFWFELSPSYTHAPVVGLTLQPQHGAPIILHKF